MPFTAVSSFMVEAVDYLCDVQILDPWALERGLVGRGFLTMTGLSVLSKSYNPRLDIDTYQNGICSMYRFENA